jgi:hypothetical protein
MRSVKQPTSWTFTHPFLTSTPLLLTSLYCPDRFQLVDWQISWRGLEPVFTLQKCVPKRRPLIQSDRAEMLAKHVRTTRSADGFVVLQGFRS